jgi:predicted nucleotidyltransferase
MDLRSIPEGMDAAVVESIDRLLDRAAEGRGVRIPLAVESGSRAWGFPSPDSDYDCRFVFVRPVDQHLKLRPLRDVIEYAPDGVFDVNGWDLAKALRLLLKGNAVIVEWLQSPIVYRGEASFRDGFLELARRIAPREAIARHYLHLGERQRRIYFEDGDSVPQKKVFYALRPAAALRWMRLNPSMLIAPMHFPTLMAECDPPAELRAEVEDLLRRKAETRELGEAPLSPAVVRFVDSEFEIAGATVSEVRWAATNEAMDLAEAFYRSALEG